MQDRLPLTLLCGFLGSGKTTLLARLLKEPEMRGTVVLVNEFGDVGLDHLLLDTRDTETRLMAGGCICCTSRNELQATLHRLLLESKATASAPVTRVVIETSGLSDPTSILASVYSDPVLSARLAPPSVVTVVDACLGMHNLAQHSEARNQVAIADRVVLSKLDIAQPQQVAPLQDRIKHLNGQARTVASHDACAGLFSGVAQVASTVSPAAGQTCDCENHAHEHPCAHSRHAHLEGVESHSFQFSESLDWDLIGHWLGSIAFFHGAQVLRIKGLVFIDTEDTPYALHGTRHVLHEPTRLAHLETTDRTSRIVFITSGMARDTLANALEQARDALSTT